MVAIPSIPGMLSAPCVILHRASEIPIAVSLDANGVGRGRREKQVPVPAPSHPAWLPYSSGLYTPGLVPNYFLLNHRGKPEHPPCCLEQAGGESRGVTPSPRCSWIPFEYIQPFGIGLPQR